MANKKQDKHSSRKVGRHFRTLPDEARFTVLHSETKYVRSGGPARCKARKAKHVAERKALSDRERTVTRIDQRLTRRVLKAASDLADALV